MLACQQLNPLHKCMGTFDDVIDTAVATGAIGSGTASLALRVGVDAVVHEYFDIYVGLFV